MVSTVSFIVISFAIAEVLAASPGQTAPASNGLRDVPRGAQAPASDSQTGMTPISPEMRGDIFMARKMYREAADDYKEGPKDSSVLLNKTAIAYHQMLDLATAEKYYRLAIKVNPQYA